MQLRHYSMWLSMLSCKSTLHSALLLAYFHMTAFIVQNATRKHHAKKEMEDKRNKRSLDLNRTAEQI